MPFLSTLSLRRATGKGQSSGAGIRISIHALLAESDRRTYHQCLKDYRFLSTLSLRRATFEYIQAGTGILFLSTLSLRRATFNSFSLNINGPLFLSTLSLRRATARSRDNPVGGDDFYPRSPCGERRHGFPRLRNAVQISIHALLAESDELNEQQKTK